MMKKEIPEVLIQEILVQLPVVSLLRFKSVCKSWRALIQSSFFIDLHTNTSSSSNKKFGDFILLASGDKHSLERHSLEREHSLIMLSSESCSESESESESDWPWIRRNNGQLDNVGAKDQVFKVMDFDTDLGGGGGGEGGGGSNDHQQLMLKLKSLGVPSEYESCYFFKQIVGSCNGLVCMYDKIPNQVSLWNPATRQFRILPEPIKIGEEGELSPSRGVVAGFGFDGEDYKVVLLTGFRPMFYKPGAQPECPCKVQVYSLSTNSWSLINQGMMISLPGDPFAHPAEGLYLNGTSSFYFMANFLVSEDSFQLEFLPNKNNRLIISFDFTEYTFNAIGIPEHGTMHNLYLSYLGDKIALFIICLTTEFDDSNIWVLEEHGGGGGLNNWEKLHSFKVQRIIPCECNFPIGISNDGEFALLHTVNSISRFGKKMKLYHFATKQVIRNFLTCSVVMNKANPYKPSLVSIIGGKTAEAETKALTDFLQGCDPGTN